MKTRLFTDRTGGVSRGRYESFNLGDHVGDDLLSVTTNRAILEKTVGPLMFMNQVHGDTVILVEGNSPITPTADAMVTGESGLALVVLVADCVPVLFWDEMNSIVAAAHVGRKGLVNGIALKTIEVMRELGATEIQAEFGPSICGSCYEVGEDVFTDVVEQVPGAQSLDSPYQFALDLPKALGRQLNEVKVQVVPSTVCTYESPTQFSYRRDGVTGRSAGVIWI